MKFNLILAVFLFGLAAADNHEAATTDPATTAVDPVVVTDPVVTKRVYETKTWGGKQGEADGNMSAVTNGEMTGTTTAGIALGFGTMAVALLTTFVMIFVDINKRQKEFEGFIEDDL